MKLFGIQLPFGSKTNRAANPPDPCGARTYCDHDRGWTTLAGNAVDSAAVFPQVVWAYRAVSVLAEQIAHVPFRLTRRTRDGEEPIHAGPLADFYAQPHPQINGFDYWELRVLWLMLRGECFRIPIYEGRKLSRVILPDPARFQHLVSGQELAGWRYTGFGPETPLASQVFLPEEVWFEKLPNPFNFWRGLAPLTAATLAAQTDFAAGSLMKGVLENNGDPGLIVRTETPLGPQQYEQLMAEILNRKRRAGHADRPLLLWGKTEVLPPSLASADLQLLENRKFLRSEICAAFGVPEEIVATTDHAKYDVMQGARLNFVQNRVAPLCRRLEAAEQVTIRALDPQASGWFDLDSLPVMEEARRQRLSAARAAFEMGIPFNELNQALDLGFKPLPWGDIGYLPNKFRPATDPGSAPEPRS